MTISTWPTVLKILLVHDVKADRAEIMREIRQSIPEAVFEEPLDMGQLGEAIDRGTFDIAITDYALSWSDGLAVLQDLKQRYPDRPVIMFTDNGSEEIAVAAMKAGADDYVSRTPGSFERLRGALRHALETKGERMRAKTAQDRVGALASDVVDDALLAITDDGQILGINRGAEELFGTSEAETIGHDGDQLVPGLHLLIATGRAATNGKRVREAMGRRPDGTPVPIELAFSDAKIGSKTVTLAVVRDLTRRRALEAQLREAQKMEAVGHLTGGIAHDFNNLLSVMIGNLEMLDGAVREQPELSIVARRALDAADRAAALTRRLLAFSRHHALKPEAVDLNSLVNGMADLIRRAIGETIDVKLVASGDLWPCIVDPVLMESALLNLAINARDAMPNGGRLTLSTANVGSNGVLREAGRAEHVALSVSDTGAGMSQEVLTRAWDPFFTTKGVGRGTGLGLSMVRSFIAQSGGHAHIDSAAGRGTTVTLYLPKCAEAPAAAGPQSPAKVSESNGATVLVVEDEPGVRDIEIAILSSIGLQTISARDAASALTAIERHPEIALLLTDVVLPGGMDGMELAEAARRMRPMLKILYASGYAPKPQLSARLAVGKSDLIQKPFRRASLIDAVNGLLRPAPRMSA
jgi:PAS domain S-box-containing protein